MIKPVNVNYEDGYSEVTDAVIDALPEILEAFENQEYENLAMDWNGGGFCHADYQGHDGDRVFITLTWKYYESNSTHMDDYHILVEEVLNPALTPFQKQSMITS